MSGLVAAAYDRLLVVAPHPDDETLACGGLIQRTLAAGGTVRVLLATDGDANPWPQRLAERRWRLGADARPRWGVRRRAEVLAAVAVLGLDATALLPLGLPDQGITRRVLDDAAALQARVATLLGAFAPTRVVYPHIADAHPDHSALGFVVEAAIAQAVANGMALPERLCYVVHGVQRMPPVPVALDLVPAELASKRAATLEHASQTLFGRERLLRLVRAVEGFHAPPTWLTPQRGSWRFAWRGHWSLAARVTPDCAVLWLDAEGRLHGSCFSAAEVRAQGGRWRRGLRQATLQLPALSADARAAWAKPIGAHRLITYDGFRWLPAG